MTGLQATRDWQANRHSNGSNGTRPRIINDQGRWNVIESDASEEGEDDNQDQEDEKQEQEEEDYGEADSFYIPSKSFAEKLAAMDPSSYKGSGDDFCTEDNFEQTSAFVNHQLSIFGFGSNLQFTDADNFEAARVVSTLYKILQQHQKDTEYKEEMDLNWRRLSSDYESTLQTLNTTKAQLERSERETDILSGKIGALEEDIRVETEKHRYTRDELKTAKGNLQYTKTQHAHEVRRKEHEMNLLKDKVQRAINKNQQSSSNPSTAGITILNPVPRSLYGKQHVSDGEQLLKEVLDQQREKELEIVDENEQLRRTLYTVHTELEGLIKKHSASKGPVSNAFGLPFEMVKEKIETEIRDTLTLLTDQWNHRPSLEPVISVSEITIRDQRIEDLEKEIERMQLELEETTLLVQGAQKAVENLSAGQFLAGVHQDFKGKMDGSEMTAQEKAQAEELIRNQREQLASERKKFTEACLDLGRQRDALKKAREEFEESKRTFRLDKVVSFLSFSPEAKKRTMNQSPPASPTSRTGSLARKRVAMSPLPSYPTGRSVKAKTRASTVMDMTHDEEELNEAQEEEEEEEVLIDNRKSRLAEGSNFQNQQGDDELEVGGAVTPDEEEDEDVEEEILRTPTRSKTTTSTHFLQRDVDLSELSRSNSEAAKARLSAAKAARKDVSGTPPPAPRISSTLFKSQPRSLSGQMGGSHSPQRGAGSPSRVTKPIPFTFTAGHRAYGARLSTAADNSSGSNTKSGSVPGARSLMSSAKIPTGASQNSTAAAPVTTATRSFSPVMSRNGGIGGNASSGSTMTGTLDFIKAARVPSALSKAAANLALRRSVIGQSNDHPSSNHNSGNPSSSSSFVLGNSALSQPNSGALASRPTTTTTGAASGFTFSVPTARTTAVLKAASAAASSSRPTGTKSSMAKATPSSSSPSSTSPFLNPTTSSTSVHTSMDSSSSRRMLSKPRPQQQKPSSSSSDATTTAAASTSSSAAAFLALSSTSTTTPRKSNGGGPALKQAHQMYAANQQAFSSKK